jgi:hypothetical protein
VPRRSAKAGGPIPVVFVRMQLSVHRLCAGHPSLPVESGLSTPRARGCASAPAPRTRIGAPFFCAWNSCHSGTHRQVRTRNPDTSTVPTSGFRIRRSAAPRNDEGEIAEAECLNAPTSNRS